MNEYDSNRISDLFIKNGYSRSFDIKDISYYVLNTCHIREKATEKVYHDVGRLKKNFKNKSKPFVLITGCVSQAENEEMLKREPFIDAVIGPQSYHKIPKIIDLNNEKLKKYNLTEFNVIEKFDELNTVKNLVSNVSAFITIQEGCDKFCNFCVVPYTRGPEYSRSSKEIVNEINTLISNGAREITLLGQNVNAYRSKNNGELIKLSGLIKKINDLNNLKRIRYTTSHPKDMSEDLINCYKKTSKLMPFIHLPVQSGSDKILKKMNRKHTIKDYMKIVEKLKNINPEINFSSDFIVGYPGETDKDFKETLSLINKVKFINSYSFIYSPRPGTPASNLKPLDEKVKKERLIILQNLLQNIQIKKNASEVGKFKEVLVENKLKNQNKYFGRTKDLTPTIIQGSTDEDIGNLVSIKIDNYNQNSFFGVKKTTNSGVAA